MTSKREGREALIEEAAKAVLDGSETPENVRDEQVWEWARRDARAAFAVFEQAHTPTDDERTPEFESLEQELFKHQPVLSMRDGHIAGCQCMDRVFDERTEDWGTHLAEVVTALRRPVQGEPTCQHGTPLTELCEHVERLVNAEPQGEPTDAQVLAAAADAIARTRGYVQGACLDEHYRDARAALRAAFWEGRN